MVEGRRAGAGALIMGDAGEGYAAGGKSTQYFPAQKTRKTMTRYSYEKGQNKRKAGLRLPLFCVTSFQFGSLFGSLSWFFEVLETIFLIRLYEI